MRKFVEVNARNIVNLEEIEYFLKEISQGIEEPEILLWIKKSLKDYIKNDLETVSKVTKFKESDPDWVKEGVENGTALKADLKDRKFNNDLNHIIDYFKSLPEIELRKISKLKFKIADAKAKQWTVDLNEKAETEEDFDGIIIVREYSEDFNWVKVFSEQALNREGKLMHHCVGSYYKKVNSGHCTVYSLRNEKNIPKCTVEVIKKEVKQIKGFANGPIKEKYVKYVKDFIEKPVKGEKYDKVEEEELQNIGILVQDGIWWNMYKLPENFTVKNDLNFADFKTLEELPKGLIIKGNLFLNGSTSLKNLPEGLIVEGNLDLDNCASLISLPEGLIVGGNLNLEYCTSLKSLPKRLKVNNTLDLTDCTSLQSLPENLTVNRDLYLSFCTSLKSLPEGLIVKRDLYLSDCTSLKSLPEGLIVKRDLCLTGCTSLKSLPEGLTLRDLYLTGCTSLKSLPKDLTVENYIFVDNIFPKEKYTKFSFKKELKE